jgi:tetratricopeptide (TPR) repeat protein
VPLLLLAGRAGSATRGWAVTFYLLALAFNYPHFMATVYRAYHTRTEFDKYRLFTLHITALLALVVVASHVWSALVPWIFTLYITWSPWHYTGQNFGLAMMFARRNGVAPTDRERRGLYLAFLASYALLFITFHTGPSSDPLIRSLGIPPSIAAPVRVLLLLVVGVLGTATVGLWFKRTGPAAMLAPFTLVVTQAAWFVVPALAQWLGGVQAPQTRYSSGVLAVMHSAQYLWITSYYARREAESSLGGTWRPWAYAATLMAGGIALFVPGPWLASYLFRSDFTQSVLIFTAVVNIHHFILDGAIWKLRDGRIAALLVDSRRRTAAGAAEAGLAVHHAARWLDGDTRWAHALRIAALVLLVGLAVVDQTRFILGTSVDDMSALTRADALNPYDSSVQRRRARLLIERQQYQDAYAEYQRYLSVHPEDGEALVNVGVLAFRLGREDEAVQRWEAALGTDSGKVNARRYLAQLWAGRADGFDRAGRTADAAHAFQRVLALDEQGDDLATLGADWFNYGQLLRRHQAEPRLVLACLMHAEDLLTRTADSRAGTVQAVRAAFEREQPGAAAIVRRSPAEALAAARARY